MELLYNPDAMSEQEIKATFVARQPLVDKLISMIKSQPDGAGVQHVVIIAPRGMGKTTVLLMVKFTLKDRGLTKNWQAVKFPEESYGIYDLADFWIQTLELLAVETGDDAPRIQAEELKKKYPNNNDLQEAALAAIKDWRRKHKKRILLLVENFDMILEQINDEQDNARLRDVLMNDGTLMLIGGATTFFKEARAYDQPLYNFFQIENLADLKFEQMQQLLRSRAEQDAMPNFDATLKANAGRLRVLEYFTGGNPRLVLMMYRVVTQSDLSEVRRGLEKLLDEVTPYYKAKIESLPPQQRKILDHIARISGKTNEGLTPAEIADAVRLSPNQVSAQLKRLAELGYVRAANMRGRSVPYTLAEPLYAIWHQMRFGRDAREKMQWLVNFLKSWYDREEMEPESEKLSLRFNDHLKSGRMREARDTLEHHRYLAHAMDEAFIRVRAIESIIQGHLELGDSETIKKELLAGCSLKDLSEGTLEKLCAIKCISKKEAQQARKARGSATPSKRDQKFTELIAAAKTAYSEDKAEEALQHFDRAIEINPNDSDAWYYRGDTLADLGKHEEAIASFNRAIEIQPDHYEVWISRGLVLAILGRFNEVIDSYDRAIEIKADDPDAWYYRGCTLVDLGRYEKALESYNRAIEIKPDDPEFWYSRGILLGKLGGPNDAIASYDRAIETKPDYHEAWYNRGCTLADLDRRDEAIMSYKCAIEIKPDYHDAWYNCGLLYLDPFTDLVRQGNFDQARQTWDKALSFGRKSEDNQWFETAFYDLQIVAQMGEWFFVRQLISESNLEEQLFPLARAIEYLQTGDEALIERLSPEVKGIVEEVVAKLRKTTNTKNKTKKS
jgi:tetratricopeptide (TPR) repeat protein